MSEMEEWIRYAETKIGDCGSADNLIELAKKVLVEGERLGNERVKQAARSTAREAMLLVAISEEVPEDWVDTLLAQY